jgi:tripartite-type tricarboxylate transporter receptor subunit TctC
MRKSVVATSQVLIASSITFAAAPASAQQDYPSRPIRLVVPYPPGGSNDFLARIYGPKIADMLGRQVVVDNRGGGNTIIGNDVVAKAPPDGYTLLLAGSSQVAIPHLYRSIPYDTINDFAGIAGIARSEFLLVVHNTLPVSSVRDLVALAKKHPGELNYATSSTGGATHLAAVQFELAAGVKMQQVPYKGGGPAMTDLLGGQVQLAFANPGSVVPLLKASRLKAIAVTGDKRIAALPNVPTFAEAGLPGISLRNWYAITAPAGTPKAIIDKLSATVLKAAAMPDVQAAIQRQGLELFTATAEQIDAIRREDSVIVAKLVKAANIKMQD